jgi:hypothetical protein
MSEEVDDVKKEYLKILLQQYSESRQSIRNYSNSIWQIPTLLVTTISVLGIAYAQLYNIQNARILVLLVGFGFTLVSLIALIKHGFFNMCRIEDFNEIQRQLKTLLEKDDCFKSFLKRINKDAGVNEKIDFREIKFLSKNLARKHRWLYLRSAYKWQRNLVISLLIGITSLLEYEFWLLGPFFLVVFGIIPFLVFGIWLLIEKKIEETRTPME